MKLRASDGKVYEIPDDAQVELKVDGIPRMVSVGEMAGGYNKGLVADHRFQSASEKERAAQEAMSRIKLQNELSLRAQEGDDDAFRELGKMMGVSPEDTEATLHEYRRTQSGGNEEGAEENLETHTPQPATLSQEDQFKINAAYVQAQETAKQKAATEMREMMNKDPELQGLTDKQKDVLLSRVMESAVVGRLQQGSPYGPATLNAGLEVTKTVAKELGIVAEPKDKAAANLQKLEQAGVTLGPSESPLVTAVQAGQLPPRLPMNSPDFEDAFVARNLLQQPSQ